ncbi:hypothetical protein SALBM217S_04072 [Streptomyces griseoloalbus]
MVRAGLVFIDRYPAFTQLYVAELWRTNLGPGSPR